MVATFGLAAAAAEAIGSIHPQNKRKVNEIGKREILLLSKRKPKVTQLFP